MQKKVMLLVLTVLLLTSGKVFAGYHENEKPVWTMVNDTAYTLNQGEWNLDLGGPVTYGISDNFQIGSIFWFWFAQIPNVYAKYTLLEEGPANPAISIGGFYRGFSFDDSDNNSVTLNWFGMEAFATKELSPGFYLNGGYSYNGLNASGSLGMDDFILLSWSGTSDTHRFIAGLINQLSANSRFYAEAVANTSIEDVGFSAGGGFEWAMGEMFRLKLGVYTFLNSDTPFYIPFINLYWRFK